MTPKKAKEYINFGHEHSVSFGEVNLTLKPGVMSVGNILPNTQGLVAHDLTPGYCISGVKKRIVIVPSLDTPVCEWQINALSQELKAGKNEELELYVLSMDTPFAQSRFIRENKPHPGIIFVSDYADRRFLEQSGLKINELSIFARAIIECDELNIVTRVSVPKDITWLP